MKTKESLTTISLTETNLFKHRTLRILTQGETENKGDFRYTKDIVALAGTIDTKTIIIKQLKRRKKLRIEAKSSQITQLHPS